jgi:hypothetical protein
LLWGILAIGAGELEAVNRQFGRQHDSAALHRGFDQISFGYADGGAKPARQSHLAFVVDFNETGHRLRPLMVKKPEGRTSAGKYSRN